MSEFQTFRETITRDSRFGLGLAISGGIDAPFEGDPAIIISDVRDNGPAEGKLKTGDHILSVNGISMINVTHNQAIDALRTNGDTLDLMVNREIIQLRSQNGRTAPITNNIRNSNHPPSANIDLSFKGNASLEYNRNNNMNSNAFVSSNPSSTMPGSEVFQSPLNSNYMSEKRIDNRMNDMSLSRASRWEDGPISIKDLGLQLASVIRVSSVEPSGLAHTEGIRSGDTIMTINGVETDHLSLVDARKLLNREEIRIRVLRVEPSGNRTFESTIRRRQNRPSLSEMLPAPSGHIIIQEPERPQLTATLQKSKPNTIEIHPPNITLKSSHSKSNNFKHSDLPVKPSLPQNHYVLEKPVWEIPRHIRRVSFEKDSNGQTGVRLSGGNIFGIFIAGVHPSSVAAQIGIKEGDRLLKVNDIDLYNKTHEEAVLAMVSAQSPLNLEISPDPEAFNYFLTANQPGDSFYIRTHFSYTPPESANEVAFHNGDVFHVRDTLMGGCIGTWVAQRIFPQSEMMNSLGSIPNLNRAEQLALTALDSETKSPYSSGPKTKSDRFVLNTLRKRIRSSSSALDSSVKSGLPAYEFVAQRLPGFTRPVVILGPLADVAKNRLLREQSQMFEGPAVGRGGNNFDHSNGDRITLRTIKDVIIRGKHCVLDCSPESVELLVFGQFAPIVIFLQPISKKQLTFLGNRHNQLAQAEQVKANWNYSKHIQTRWKHIYSESVTLTNNDDWFSHVIQAVTDQQNSVCWMSTSKLNAELDENEIVVFSRGDILRSSVPNLTLKTDFQLQNPPEKFRSHNSTSVNPRLTRKHSFSDPNLDRHKQDDREFRSYDADQFVQPRSYRPEAQAPRVELRQIGPQPVRIDNGSPSGNWAPSKTGWVPPEMDLRAAKEQYGAERRFSAGIRSEPNRNRRLENAQFETTNGPSRGPPGGGGGNNQIFKSSNFIEFKRATPPQEDSPRVQLRQDHRYQDDRRENHKLEASLQLQQPRSDNHRISHNMSLSGPRNGNHHQEEGIRRPFPSIEIQGGIDRRAQIGKPVSVLHLQRMAEATGRFDHRGGILNVVGTGVSLKIPSDALPYQSSQLIFLKVYQDSKSSSDGRPFFMIMCGPPNLRFNRPVELTAPVQRQDAELSSRSNSSGWPYHLLHASLETGKEPLLWSENHLNHSTNLKGFARLADQNTLSIELEHF